jgi:diguanylate cyclase (GGDEF)-like protein/PAS domain S-box-containing protein
MAADHLRMKHWISHARRRLGRVSGRGTAAVVMSVVVVLAMVAAAAFSRQSADLHRRAQVLVEQLRGNAQELSALRWRVNTQILLGNTDLAPVVTQGVGLVTAMNAQLKQLGELQPGADTARLKVDVNQFYAIGSEQLAAFRQLTAAKKNPNSLHAVIASQFQPVLDRMDSDAQRAALHQQAVAAAAIVRSDIGSIGSMLLGLGALLALGLRSGRLRRRAMLADEVRVIERRSEQRIRALVEQSSDVVTVLGRDLRVRWQAASMQRVLGYEAGSLVDAPISSIAHPDDAELFDTFLETVVDGRGPATLRARLRHADGTWCEFETVAENRFADPAVDGLVLNMRDISERKAFEDELRHQAFHDSLTGLANRALYENRLQHALAGSLRARHSLAVLFLDLDDFKTINDSLGHRAGDALLQGIAARIDPLLRPTDTAARLGGDEFAVLLDGVDGRMEARAIAERILAALRAPFAIDERELSVTASVGIALNDGAVQAAELLRNADIAMYAAKADGKNSVHAFEQRMHTRALERLELRGELQRALVEEQFYLDYQPIVSLDESRAVGVEALVRWMHPTRGRVAPDQFIALTEETGLIVPLGRWILERACAQMHEWHLALPAAQSMYVCVNVSIRQLQERDFSQTVADVLASTALEPGSLVLEITEGLLADDRDAIVRQLTLLKQLGLRIAVDDFGTGYSSLSHLRQFPIDILKIDKSFIDELHGDHDKANLVQAIINIGESLHVDVIAEGIEHQQQADRLKRMNSQLGQGYLFSRPIPPNEVLALMQAANGSLTHARS